MRVAARVGRDWAIWASAFAFATWWRFGDFGNVENYALSIVPSGMIFCAACYVFGLYSRERLASKRFLNHIFLLSGAILIGCALAWIIGSLRFTSRLGRGVTLRAVPIIWICSNFHHWLLFHRWLHRRERMAFIVNSPADMDLYRHLRSTSQGTVEFVGVILSHEGVLESSAQVLGEIKESVRIASDHRLDGVVFSSHDLSDPLAWGVLSRLRYSGCLCISVASLCEELYHCIPMGLVTPEWLLQASSLPRRFYLQKIKRIFDIVVSGFLLVLLSPFLALGIILVKAGSRGPLFYRQVRLGRFGRKITVTKLRTMRVDAEKDGAQWAQGDGDRRQTAVGSLLRKFRVDEIPQLISILRGDMSFVGPRPERPEFLGTLEAAIPYYRERLLVQPGLSGWAQVNYPYGSSIEEAKRKLEFDLYYIKHMGLLLDLIILFDTVRIVLMGGIGSVNLCPSYESSSESAKAVPLGGKGVLALSETNPGTL